MASQSDNFGMNSPAPALLHSAFYAFVDLPDPAGVVAELRRISQGVLGSILVATEGVNGAVAGPLAEVQAFEQALRSPGFCDGVFAAMAFKHSQALTPPFGRMVVNLKPEIVALGKPEVRAAAPDASHLSPQAWRALLAEPDVVLLDNRNRFEHRLGHFVGTPSPPVGNFREFADHVEAMAPQWRAERRKVAMYCTGGIRCEKTGAWMQSLGLETYQLQGGILNYFAQMPDAERDWVGECYVFDRRVALDTHLSETATTAEQVYDPSQPDEAWRLARALRLDQLDDDPST